MATEADPPHRTGRSDAATARPAVSAVAAADSLGDGFLHHDAVLENVFFAGSPPARAFVSFWLLSFFFPFFHGSFRQEQAGLTFVFP
jgi:hypothetical protein